MQGNGIVVAAALAAAIWDLRFHRIPKWLTLPAAAAGLLDHAWVGGLEGALLAMAVGLAAGLVLFQLGAIAGGDVKWLSALGAMLGWHLWLWSVECGCLAAGAIALFQMARRGRLGFVVDDCAAVVHGWRQYGFQRQPGHNVATPGAIVAPFAVSMLAGVACALWLL